MNMVYNTLLNDINFKVARLPELKQYQVLALVNMLIDTISVTKDFTDKEKEQFEIIEKIEQKYPRLLGKLDDEVKPVCKMQRSTSRK